MLPPLPQVVLDTTLQRLHGEWALLFIFVRYLGLRVPTEIHKLKWEHIDWINNVILIHSEKTKHHDGKSKRFPPLFPSIRTFLEMYYPEAPKLKGYIFSKKLRRIRTANGSRVSLANPFRSQLKKANIEPWEDSLQRLRKTRATELLRQGHSLKVVASWLGNSDKILMGFYEGISKSGQRCCPQGESNYQRELPFAFTGRGKLWYTIRTLFRTRNCSK